MGETLNCRADIRQQAINALDLLKHLRKGDGGKALYPYSIKG